MKLKALSIRHKLKNALSTTHGNVPKFNLKICLYAYDEIVCFPRSHIDYETMALFEFEKERENFGNYIRK